MLRSTVLFAAALSLSVASPQSSQAGLIINLSFSGGTAAGLTGTGSLTSTMSAAAKVWELAFNDASFNHSLDISYAWAALSGGTLAVHSLGSQGGSPNRETSAQIRFDNSNRSFFADGTLNPADPIGSGNSEYTTYTETSADFGGGSMNKGRVFTGATGDAAGEFDLYSIALHEIGHALGMSSANTSYQDETWTDNDVDVIAPLPFAGSSLPTNNSGPVPPGTSNAHLNIGTALLFPSISTGIRKLPSAADILANAQLSQFFNPNLDLMTSVPEPSGLLFLLTASIVVCRWRISQTRRGAVPFGRLRRSAATRAH
jgi:hypothetical protein